jgi:Fic family protein
MTTLRCFRTQLPSIPTAAAWYLTDIAEAKGRQDLFTRQAPQRLKALREHAMIESAISSNRIEGVEIEASRAKAVVLARPVLRDRNEEEVKGYRDALNRIHSAAKRLPISEATILELHRIMRGDVGDAGEYKQSDVDIIERSPDGRSRVRFKTVTAKRTPSAMKGLIDDWAAVVEESKIPPLLAVAAFNLDYLCVHPFRDGNGRLSRLLLLLQCYHLDIEVGRYISVERIIEQNKERYYETLEQSSAGWHEGKHDPWPYVQFVLYVLKSAHAEFAQRLGDLKAPRGEKSTAIMFAIVRAGDTFTVAELQRECPGVSIDMIRRVLKDLQRDDAVECLGRGRAARWRRIT